MKNYSYLYINKQTKGRDFLKSKKNMTRKEAATIMKKYEKNGMIGINVKQEYFIAKQIWNQIVKQN